MIDIDNLRKLNTLDKIIVSEHSAQRMHERGITVRDVQKVISEGEIIKQYEDDKPFPSCLIMGMSVSGRYVHVVVSTDKRYIYLITVYRPDLEVWESDYKTRRKI